MFSGRDPFGLRHRVLRVRIRVHQFIDTVGDFAIGMMVGGGVPTINLRVDYLKPAVGDGITGTAQVRRAGRTVAVVDIDVFDEKGSLVAVGRGTYSSRSG